MTPFGGRGGWDRSVATTISLRSALQRRFIACPVPRLCKMVLVHSRSHASLQHQHQLPLPLSFFRYLSLSQTLPSSTVGIAHIFTCPDCPAGKTGGYIASIRLSALPAHHFPTATFQLSENDDECTARRVRTHSIC
jgi:hypothetical protein